MRRKDSRFNQKKFLESQTGLPQATWLLLSLVLGFMSKYRFFCLLPTTVAGKLLQVQLG